MSCTLDLWNAELSGSLVTTLGSITFTALVAHGRGALLVHATAAGDEFTAGMFTAGNSDRGAPDISWAQHHIAGQELRVAACLEQTRGTHEDAARRALAADPHDTVAEHRAWWQAFYRRSFVSVPDKSLQRLHWTQMYTAASVTDATARGLSNTPALLCASNHLDIVPLAEALRDGLPLLGHDHLVTALPGVGSKAGRAQHPVLASGAPVLWDIYRCTDDLRVLELLHPALRRVVDFYAGFLVEGGDGRLHLPVTHSPGQADVVDCTHDLSLLRWAATTLIHATRRLKRDEPRLGQWRDIAARLVPYHRDAHGVLLGQGAGLTRSDPDAAHLLWLRPLGEKSWARPGDRDLMRRSFDHWAGMPEGWHAGTHALAASLTAAMHDAEQALVHLQHLTACGDGAAAAASESVLLPNTLYGHGDSLAAAAPFAAGQAMLDLLLQEESGTVEVFPAVSETWRDICVAGLRAPGGFLVDASRRDGRTQWVRVHGESGRTLKLRHGIEGGVQVLLGEEGSRRHAEVHPSESGTVTLALSEGETATVVRRGMDPAQEMSEVPSNGNSRRWGDDC
ncbi:MULTISPECIES: glycosyl hydrolase family 95 catalytic domain-containing protein [Streptomyces]|uniref:glycosyl hydrolase family 95 catalytic domain-containing protein n=1 Tax=Streptomyces TaxID=1883 RepID=UPI000B843DAC|nr:MULTISPECIES: hypothetical protein [unclassified Streptomyces]MYT16143.1 hypothetical protein [Streptomyces sp. SID4951]